MAHHQHQKIIIAGGSGFIGRALSAALLARGDAVTVLSRSERLPSGFPAGAQAVQWDGRTVGSWARVLDGADALVNLAGRSVNTRFTPEARREVLSSRVDAITALREALRQTPHPPSVWVNAGGKDIYGDTGEKRCDENTPPAPGLLTDVCVAWESAFVSAVPSSVRGVLLRIGVVLGDEGALPVLTQLTRAFLGGAIGSGRQYLSWIHIADMTAMQLWAVDNARADGVYNATAPEPVTNSVFMAEMRHVLKRPWCPPAPGFMVQALAPLINTEAGLLLEGNRVMPTRAVAEGFTFRFSQLRSALSDLLVR
jgi:uncharacterized protein